MTFSKRLIQWYQNHGRQDLPWRQNITPYRIWLSEIMLQQTQVATVLDYFKRFITTFPTVETLAEAHEDQVYHLWSGLGYYTRARNLHKTAKIIQTEFAGKFPTTIAELETLPGIGPSTAAAIYSLSYDKPAAIMDGNVKRVLSRYFAIEGWPGSKENLKQLWQSANNLLPKQSGHDYTQAIMDLGATICTRNKPNCQNCPVSKNCKARQFNLTDSIPGRKPSTTKPEKQAYVLIIKLDNKVLLEKRPPVGIWGGLWCFPMYEKTQLDIGGPLTALPEICHDQFHIHCQTNQVLQTFRHTFSHFHLQITPIELTCQPVGCSLAEAENHNWFDNKSSQNLGLAAPIKKLLHREVFCTNYS